MDIQILLITVFRNQKTKPFGMTADHAKRPAGFDVRTGTKFRAEGEVIRILQRKVQQVVGTFENSKHFGFVVPDDKRFGSDIFIAKEDFNGARNGMKVLVEITSWPQKTRSAEGCSTL